jgi:hypothetical protein
VDWLTLCLADYCDVCRAEYERRAQTDFKQPTSQQRAQLRVAGKGCPATDAGLRNLWRKVQEQAMTMSAIVSDRCRQQAHRKAVTEGMHGIELRFIVTAESALSLRLDRHRAIYLNDLLSQNRTRAQYQAVALIAAKLEAEGKIDSMLYFSRWNHPAIRLWASAGTPSRTWKFPC